MKIMHLLIFVFDIQASGSELVESLKLALDIGYRMIDTAYSYQNEEDVGEAIKSKLEENVLTREELFVCTKLWNTYHRPDLVKVGLDLALKNLKLDYIDLFIIHWPLAFKEGAVVLPRDEKQEIIESNVDIVDTWKSMIELVKTGKVRSIGVANFNHDQLERILKATSYVPVVNQIECHPYLTQKKLDEYCKSKKIHIIAYAPLGSPNRPHIFTGEPNLFADPHIIALAKRHNRTQAQIMIKYQLQKKHTTIPKSVTPRRIISNFDVFNFFLSTDDMLLLDGLNFNRRMVPFVGFV